MHNSRLSEDPLELDSVIQSGAIHAALEGIVTIDEAMHIVMINPAAQRMFGRSAAQVLGQDLSVLIPGALRELHTAHVQTFMASGVVERPMRALGALAGLRADGSEFPLEAAICQVDTSIKLGGHRYFTAMLRDLSNEQKLAAQIDQLNRRMRTLFDLLPVAIWITEGESVVYANSACARLFGVADRESLTGQSIYALLHPETHEQVREKVAHALTSEEEVLPMHGKIARRDGLSRDVEMVVAALPDHSRTLVQMVLSDITKQSQERRALLESKRTLRNLAASLVDTREEERRRIARELHDELGQRLTALKLELSALERIGTPGILSTRTQSMIEMVDDTVAAMRRIALDLRPLMLDDLGLSAAIEWLAQETERRSGLQVALRCDPLPDLIPQKVLTALYRIVQEALTNIVRHARATRVVIAMAHTGSFIELHVEDNGDGFPEQPLQASGKSFGLIGIRERVLMLGGELNLGNLPGGRREHGRDTAAVRCRRCTRRFPMKETSMNILLNLLLVDDHTVVREGLKRLIDPQANQWSITEAGTGFHALECLRRQPFDLAIVDLSMPGMSGLELTRRIKSEFPSVAVLVLTMHSEEQYAIRALQAGANGFVTKDSAATELVAAVRKVASGGVFLSAQLAERVVQQLNGHTPVPDLQALTNRELDILQRIVNGQRPVDIADALHLSIKTVSTHKKRIQEKLKLDSTAALVRFGLEHQLGSDVIGSPISDP